MKIKTNYITKSTGVKIPIEIQVKRTTREVALKHSTKDIEVRNNWCNGGGLTCAKYGARPCCPPKTKMIGDMKSRKYLYLIHVKIDIDDYYEVYPKVKASKSWQYFGMDGTHKMTRNVSNKIVRAVTDKVQGDVPFRVGGCLGCQFAKTGKCIYYMPPLESSGIDVVAITKEVFNSEIVWRVPKESMPYMIAVGAVYSDRPSISKDLFKEAIKDACNHR